jgi:hypothetical protein
MANANGNARDLVERIWERADGQLLDGEPVLPDLPDYESPEHDGDLRYVNSHWSIDPAYEGPARGGEWKVRAKERLSGSVFGVLDRYFEQERDFFAHGVRVQNKLAGWCSRLAREVRTVAQALNDESNRLVERQDVLHRRMEDRVAALEARLETLEQHPKS